MDDSRFDALAKRFARGFSRRDVFRGLASLTGAGAVAIIGRTVATATSADCGSRCSRLPAGASRDRCQAACAKDDALRATAAAKRDAVRATAAAESDAARALADAIRACKGDKRRLCGGGVDVVCCAPDEECQNDVCVPKLGCTPTGSGCSVTDDCCAENDCCAGACANLQTDSAHCGACDSPCSAGQVCDGGTCCTTLTCQPGQCGNQPDGCGGTLHCGACGSGQTCCAGTCADLQTDAKHCGTCGHACPTGQICCDGACAEPCYSAGFGCCPTGQSCCGSVCCATGRCCGGECCETGQTCCGSVCCAAGQTCCGGVECCEASSCCPGPGTCCGSGMICCGDECTTIDDPENCGTCDNTCDPSQVCLGTGGCCTPGTCAGRCGDVSDGCNGTLHCGDCPTGQCLTCDVPTGTCVTTCPQGQVCNGGSCCSPATCQAKQCGSYSDGCGGTTDCGSCADGEICVNNGCFIAGNSDTCSFSSENACPCNSDQDCCSCSNGFDGTIDHICWRAQPEPATIDCFKGNADCPHGWACFTIGNPPTCVPPC